MSEIRHNVQSIRAVISFLFVCILPSILHADTKNIERRPIFIIGQDVQSINDYISASRNYPNGGSAYPDGFMVYTAINDLRGLSDAVDQGGGTNYADKTIHAYPKFQVVQIGLYMCYMLQETVKGSFDDNINKLGQWIKNSNKDVYLRIGYEFDNPDNNYDPKEYIQAYKYIVDKLRKMNVTNVHYVWHSMAWKDKNWPAYDPLKWYPGDNYVDWMGISFFDSQRNDERDQAAIIARKINKPLMIAESSPFKQYSTEDKIQWIKILFQYIKANNVTFLSYINVNWDGLPQFATEKWGDARLQNEPILLNEWLKQVEQFY